MKLSVQWLREWADPQLDLEGLVSQLTMAGLEVDDVSPVAGSFDGVIVGQILATEFHPKADRLTLCEVDIGQKRPLKIVCGASNVRPTLKVAVACVGASLPNDIKIEKTYLREELSEGMLCSSDELGMESRTEGIMELPQDAPIGEDVRAYLQLNDHSLDIDLTPNRGDCLGVLGIAREVATLNQCELNTPPIKTLSATNNAVLAVSIENYQHCGQYYGRVIKNIDNTVSSPIWLVEKLRRSGVRSLSPVVDVTNYVMLELGQPLHAFDSDKLDGGIVVRLAQQGEHLTLLDGQEIKLRDDSLLIADQTKALALAGIMGGLDSAVDENTTDIFLESAFFAPHLIAGKARSYGLATDSSHRFERGVDPSLQQRAIERASELLLQIVGGELGPVVVEKDEQYLPQPQTVEMRVERVRRVIGENIPETTLHDILTRLQMEMFPQGETWLVRVPSHRFDISIEADLIEEFARIYGYNNIPDTHLVAPLRAVTPMKESVPLRPLTQCLVERGYLESISYSFVDPRLQALVYPERQSMELLNPISSELSHMRTGLWPGLLASALYNQHRQCNNFKLFESGLSFIKHDGGLEQSQKIAGVCSGKKHEDEWNSATRDMDFYDIKGEVEALLRCANDQLQYNFEKAEHKALHPGQSAKITCGKKSIGWLGSLHPQILAAMDLTAPVLLFELDLGQIPSQELPQFQKISKYPSIRRDISFIIDATVDYQAIRTTIDQHQWLQSLDVFDVYQGKGIDSGKKSIAISLTLQHPSRTLVDSEITSFIDAIIQRLKEKFDITLRE